MAGTVERLIVDLSLPFLLCALSSLCADKRPACNGCGKFLSKSRLCGTRKLSTLSGGLIECCTTETKS